MATGRRDLLLTGVTVLLVLALLWVVVHVSPFAALAVAIGVVLFVALGTDRTGVLCLIGAFATAPMSRGLDRFTAGIGTPTDLFLVLSWLLLLPTLAPRKLRLPVGWSLGLVALFGFSLLGSAVSSTAVASLTSLFQWAFFLGALPVLVAWWRPASARIAQLLWAYVAGQCLSTIVGLLHGKDPITLRYQGLAIHPNGFGLAGLVALAMLFYLYDHHREQGMRLLIAGAGALCLASIWLSGSRAALAVAIALFIMIPIVERSAISGAGIFVVGGLVLGAAPLILSLSGQSSALGRLTGSGTAAEADTERSTAFHDGLNQFLHAPLTGSGLYNVELIHNLFLEAAVAAGIVGLISYLVIIGTLAKPLFGTGPDRRLAWLGWVVLGVAAALPGLWDRTLWVPASLAILPALRALDPAVPKGAGSAASPASPPGVSGPHPAAGRLPTARA